MELHKNTIYVCYERVVKDIVLQIRIRNLIYNIYYISLLKEIYQPLYSMNKFVTNATRWGTLVSIYGVIGYHVTLRGSHDSQSPHIRT